MYQTLNGFFKSWEFEANCTQKLLNTLTDESLKQEITSENWTLGRVAWHMVTAIRIITSNTSLTFDAPTKDYSVPTRLYKEINYKKRDITK
ncbi:DinB family protein [Lysinibacillus sp. NPDC056232]|uniref:DinB family protein n=1 Tax=Lysinibacillus sp. NPDC056232 TaxID=3345756 RepID=UPI0035E11F65